MRPKPKPSEHIRAARKKRHRLSLRWGLAILAAVAGIALGASVWHWIQVMEVPGRRPGGKAPGHLAVWWYDFARSWRWVLGAAAIGVLGVLFPALSFLERRKQAASMGFGIVCLSTLMMLLPETLRIGASAWEILLPVILCGLGTNLLLGTETPPTFEDAPLVLKNRPSNIPPSQAAADEQDLPWRLTYTSSFEQAVDTQMAVMHDSGDLFFRKLFRAIGVVFLFLFVYLLLPGRTPEFMIVLGVIAAAWIVIRWRTYNGRKRKEYEKLLAKDPDESFPVNLEWSLEEDGLRFRNEIMEMYFRWTVLEVVQERDHGLYLVFRGAGRGFIPDHAFSDAAQKRRWQRRMAAHLPTASA